MSTTWTIRQYEKSDWSLVSSWWDSHSHGNAIMEAILPPLGVVVERDGLPVCAVWLYMAVNIGVCWLDYPVSRPGLRLSESKQAFGLALGALEAAAKANDYGIMFANTLPAIAHVMRGFGFHAENRKKVTVLKILN